MKEIINSGEHDPRRVIALLQNHEKFNPVRINNGAVTPKSDKPENINNFPCLPTGEPIYRIIPSEGKFVKVPSCENKVSFLVDFLRGRRVDAVVELGSGYAQNLFELYYSGGPKGIPYYAGEFTESGTHAAMELSKLSTDVNVIPFRFDHNDPDLSIIKETDEILIFTAHSIEQVPELPSDYFAKLASVAKKVTGVHFEPFGFQLPRIPDDVSTAQKEWFVKNGWNLNFAKVLWTSHERGDIRVVYAERDILGAAASDNPTSIAIWESQ